LPHAVLGEDVSGAVVVFSTLKGSVDALCQREKTPKMRTGCFSAFVAIDRLSKVLPEECRLPLPLPNLRIGSSCLNALVTAFDRLQDGPGLEPLEKKARSPFWRFLPLDRRRQLPHLRGAEDDNGSQNVFAKYRMRPNPFPQAITATLTTSCSELSFTSSQHERAV